VEKEVCAEEGAEMEDLASSAREFNCQKRKGGRERDLSTWCHRLTDLICLLVSIRWERSWRGRGWKAERRGAKKRR